MYEHGIEVMHNIRDRYDGSKRNPFNEAECGNHYARAMASWAGIIAESGFQYSGIEKRIHFTSAPGDYFWSNGSSWGMCSVFENDGQRNTELKVLSGRLELNKFMLGKDFAKTFNNTVEISEGESISLEW